MAQQHTHLPHSHHMLIGDGGFKSRKFIAFIISNVLLLCYAAIAATHPALVSMFPEYATGVIAVFTVYLGGNLGGKYTIGKAVGADNAMAVTSNKDPVKPEPAKGEAAPGSAKVPQ